jgi:hypothetical protein
MQQHTQSTPTYEIYPSVMTALLQRIPDQAVAAPTGENSRFLASSALCNRDAYRKIPVAGEIFHLS